MTKHILVTSGLKSRADLGFLLGGGCQLRGSIFSRLKGGTMAAEGGNNMTAGGGFMALEGSTMTSESGSRYDFRGHQQPAYKDIKT